MASPLFSRVLPFGHLVGLALAPADDAGAVDALVAALEPEEQALARTFGPARRQTWAGGRLALRAALAELGVVAGPLLSTPRGGPVLPVGVAGSISHKGTLAVALAARAPDGATLGIDVELDRAPRVDIAPRVLTPTELLVVDALAPAVRLREILLTFAAKEAIFKALDPWVGRFVSFREAAVARAPGGGLTATLALRGGEGPFSVELHEEPAEGLIIVAARVRGPIG